MDMSRPYLQTEDKLNSFKWIELKEAHATADSGFVRKSSLQNIPKDPYLDKAKLAQQ